MNDDLVKKLKKQGTSQLQNKLATADEATKAIIADILVKRGAMTVTEGPKKSTQKREHKVVPLSEELKETKDALAKDAVGKMAKFTPHREDFEVEGIIISVSINRANNTFFYFIKSADKRLKKPVHAKRINKVEIV